MPSTVDIVYSNHTADFAPGDLATVSEDEARRLEEAGMARRATRKDIAAAEEAEAAEDAPATEDAPAKKK